MDITGTQIIRAPRDKVWDALMNPDILARSIDGVESLTKTDDGFAGKMRAKVGPVRAVFAGSVTITETERPERYALAGEGKGGVAGFAKGGAEIHLIAQNEETTRLDYTATSQVGGKLAQLGARLVEGAAKGYAERFFENFRAEVEADGAADIAPETAAAPAPSPVKPATTPAPAPVGTVDANEPFRSEKRGLPPAIWATATIILLAGIVALQFL